METFLRQKNILTDDSSLCNNGVQGGRIKHNGNDWRFQSYKVTNVGSDMLCESLNSDQEEKQ